MKVSLVFFRNDLRLRDNVTFQHAVGSSDVVYPVYCFDPRHFEPNSIGLPKTGYYRTRFLMESVMDLKEQLRERGSDLIIRYGLPEEVIPRIAGLAKASQVYLTREVTHEEVRVEDMLEKELWQSSIPLNRIWQSTLLHEEDIPWPVKHLPDVFSDFRKEADRYTQVRSEVNLPKFMERFTDIEPGNLPDLETLGIEEKQADERSVLDFKGGEAEAWKRIQHYFWESDQLKSYKKTRNGLIGGDYSSKLSPWLALGCISPRSIYWEVRKYEQERVKNDSTYWLVFELLWRDFFRFTAKKQGDKIFKITGIRNKEMEFANNDHLFSLWVEGRTGSAFVDANMRELNATGFMSNRGRQNVASYLVHNLKVNWTWGADYFESMLIDYDPCSNWGNWNYVAGVGNDPRQDRYFNVESQARRYDPRGEYVNLWKDPA